ncbi:MAG TPA: transcription elongation factor GreA [Chloroflexi bacterium]|nr:transcription elongation factor GreA [Chloroflexota bacterium]
MGVKPVYLTPEGQKKLVEELQYLTSVKRVEVAAAIQSAKEEGDLSENAAYDEAKAAQGFMEGRIQTLQALLQEAVIIEPKQNSDVVALGSKVTVVEEDDDDPETYTIVGSAEADPMEEKISNESPIGGALLNHKVGDVVAVQTPGGEIRLKITKIA